MAKLTAVPLSALVDEPVHIQVTGLAPFQVVCLQASLKDEKGNLFSSQAFYRASEVGEVDLDRQQVGLHGYALKLYLPHGAFCLLSAHS